MYIVLFVSIFHPLSDFISLLWSFYTRLLTIFPIRTFIAFIACIAFSDFQCQFAVFLSLILKIKSHFFLSHPITWEKEKWQTWNELPFIILIDELSFRHFPCNQEWIAFSLIANTLPANLHPVWLLNLVLKSKKNSRPKAQNFPFILFEFIVAFWFFIQKENCCFALYLHCDFFKNIFWLYESLRLGPPNEIIERISLYSEMNFHCDTPSACPEFIIDLFFFLFSKTKLYRSSLLTSCFSILKNY